MLQFKAKKPPYRVALANGYIGNTWRIEMIKCLEAYAQDPEIKPLIKELKIVSTGTDVAAQIGAVDNFINAGYDVVLIDAVSSDPDFTNPVTVPDGFVEAALTIPFPKGKTLYIKLRDDPSTVNTVAIP